MKFVRVFKCVSILDSAPVFKSILIARVATLKLLSDTNASNSWKLAVTFAFTLLRILNADTLTAGLDPDKTEVSTKKKKSKEKFVRSLRK